MKRIAVGVLFLLFELSYGLIGVTFQSQKQSSNNCSIALRVLLPRGLPVLTDPDFPTKEINLEQLDKIVHSEEDKYFLQSEFVSIKRGKRKPWTVAELPENLPKNRYDDLLAYDETRVKLEPRDYDNSDYINANFIDGYYGEKEYVATQGPLPNTTKDFWEMIWQLGAEKIVMVADLFEHGQPKVDKYWPDDINSYGNIIVTKLSDHEILKYNHVIRTFSVRKVGILPPRIVRQFHYTRWPDLGVPEDRLSVIVLMNQVRKYKPESKAPIVIHCSAGVGRTGTVILMDYMIQRGLTEGLVDFPKTLNEMRLQRVDLVEKKDQYIFVHEAVSDLFNGTETKKYLNEVHKEYKVVDKEVLLKDFQIPETLEESLEQIKAYNHRMTVLIEAAKKKFGKEIKKKKRRNTKFSL